MNLSRALSAATIIVALATVSTASDGAPSAAAVASPYDPPFARLLPSFPPQATRGEALPAAGPPTKAEAAGLRQTRRLDWTNHLPSFPVQASRGEAFPAAGPSTKAEPAGLGQTRRLDDWRVYYDTEFHAANLGMCQDGDGNIYDFLSATNTGGLDQCALLCDAFRSNEGGIFNNGKYVGFSSTDDGTKCECFFSEGGLPSPKPQGFNHRLDFGSGVGSIKKTDNDDCNAANKCYPLREPLEAPSNEDHAWDAAWEGVESDFSTPDGAVVNSSYVVGKAGAAEVLVEAVLYEEDCATAAGGGVLELLEPNPQRRRPRNGTHDTVIVQVGINKTSLGNSSFYDAGASIVSFCQKLQVKTNSSLLSTQLVVTELVQLIKMAINNTATFALGGNLTGAEVGSANETVDLSNSVRAIRCRKNGADVGAEALSPNDELSVCLQPVGDGVRVASVESMTLAQDGVDKFKVVAGGEIQVNSITSWYYNDPVKNGWLISTRVPANLVTFAAEKTLVVSGSVTMGLVGGAGRRLQAAEGSGLDQEEEARFDVEVDLRGEEAVNGVAALSPAASVKAKGGAAAAALFVASALAFFMG